MAEPSVVAVIGGTGAEGGGLAKRWAAAGHTVIIGSRSAERAAAKADEIDQALDGHAGAAQARGAANEAAAAEAEIVVLTVPYGAHADTLGSLRETVQGKILVDCTVPLKPPKISARAIARSRLRRAGGAGPAGRGGARGLRLPECFRFAAG